MPKFITKGEAETKRQKAIEFMERIGGDADKFRDMDAAKYAESRGVEFRENSVRSVTAMTKSELAETLDELADGLDECLDPQLSREDLVAKIKDLSDIASGEESEDDETGDAEESDED